MIAKDKGLLDEGNTKIKALQDTVKANAETIGKDQTDLAAKDDAINWLKNNIQAKDMAIAKDKVDLESRMPLSNLCNKQSLPTKNK